MIINLGGTELANLNEATSSDILAGARVTISNVGSTSVQHNAYLKTGTADAGGSGTTLASSAIDTSVSTNLTYDLLPAAANEVISLNSLDIELVI